MAGTELSNLLYNKDSLVGDDLVPVTGVDLGSGGYEWDELHAFYSPSRRRFFWYSDSGCSCNSWGDELRTIDDFENGTKADLMAAINRYCDDGYGVTGTKRVDALYEANAFNTRKLS